MALTDFYFVCHEKKNKQTTGSRYFPLVIRLLLQHWRVGARRSLTAQTGFPLYSMMLGNKIPRRAVSQLYIFRAVCAPIIDSENYTDGQANKSA